MKLILFLSITLNLVLAFVVFTNFIQDKQTEITFELPEQKTEYATKETVRVSGVTSTDPVNLEDKPLEVTDSPLPDTVLRNLDESRPAIARVRKAQMARRISKEIVPFINQLELSVNERSELLELMTERASIKRDTSIALAQNNVRDKDLIDTALKNELNGIDSEINKRLMGAGGQDIESLINTSRKLNDIQTTVERDMKYAGFPLNDSQIVNLAKVMEDLNYSPRAVPPNIIFKALGEEPQRSPTRVFQEVIVESSSFLSAEQIQVLSESHRVKMAQQNNLDRNLQNSIPEGIEGGG